MVLKYLVPLLLKTEVQKYIDSKKVVWCYILFNNVRNHKNGRKIVLGIKCVFHFAVQLLFNVFHSSEYSLSSALDGWRHPYGFLCSMHVIV